MRCPHCGYEDVSEKARLCPECGHLLPPSPAVDFSNHIAKHTRDFTGREWVFA